MSNFLEIDSDVWVIIFIIIIVIQGFALLLRRRSSGIEPTTTDLFKEWQLRRRKSSIIPTKLSDSVFTSSSFLARICYFL